MSSLYKQPSNGPLGRRIYSVEDTSISPFHPYPRLYYYLMHLLNVFTKVFNKVFKFKRLEIFYMSKHYHLLPSIVILGSSYCIRNDLTFGTLHLSKE